MSTGKFESVGDSSQEVTLLKPALPEQVAITLVHAVYTNNNVSVNAKYAGPDFHRSVSLADLRSQTSGRQAQRLRTRIAVFNKLLNVLLKQCKMHINPCHVKGHVNMHDISSVR